ncbi:amino acid ABC transporter permease [Paracraurococcus ruber]|uniref:Amino acid ABC transporter permease n=1 Tax=Paracraurococcus ruber TaxID=77675 RepID=A0ABS1D4S7_9PROT|nr:ABC transporter permease subunit [Paracraurococcus ruber]MBK1661809.1 amino acid ABC transporter permease [Paracraurococcus ruber]TDG14570.1 ABC transporter permease subunit [Paracraurococcus ruber]
MSDIALPAARRAPPLPRFRMPRGLLWQALLLAAVLGLGWWFWGNVQANMAKRGLELGFGFLDRAAGIPIGEAVVEYTPASSYARALWVGFLNTLRVAVVGCVIATILGIALGVMRLSPNPLLRGLVGGYVEIVRNTPLVLQLVFWHAVILGLPPVRQALEVLPGVFLSQRGMKIPVLVASPAMWALLAALAAGALGWWLLLRRERARQAATGQRRPTILPGLAMLLGLPALSVLALGAPQVEWPELTGFNFQGGVTLSPEFVALLTGLVVYTAAFVAEIVRAGIQSVHRGQWEAAFALGLPRGRIMRLVILPQALRVIIPPMTSQFLNLTKNSSLAIVIGYPDLVSVANTAINQTGQAIEVISIFMAVYLAMSLLTSLAMNLYNRSVQIRER